MLCEGKVAIVTGAAGKGMGRSIALTLAREGAIVTVNYLTSVNEASTVVNHIKSQGGKAMAFQADVNRQDNEGITPLMEAASIRSSELVRLLLEHGADANIKDRGGRTAMDIARKKRNKEVSAILKASLAKAIEIH